VTLPVYVTRKLYIHYKFNALFKIIGKSKLYSVLPCIRVVYTILKGVQKLVHITYFVKLTRKTKRAERKKSSCTEKSRMLW
jgi:hypothetical protein